MADTLPNLDPNNGFSRKPFFFFNGAVGGNQHKISVGNILLGKAVHNAQRPLLLNIDPMPETRPLFFQRFSGHRRMGQTGNTGSHSHNIHICSFISMRDCIK